MRWRLIEGVGDGIGDEASIWFGCTGVVGFDTKGVFGPVHKFVGLDCYLMNDKYIVDDVRSFSSYADLANSTIWVLLQ
jgi:hypothetical protein